MATIIASALLLILSLGVRLSSADDSEEADEPYNLRVAHLTESKVLLGWSFAIPPGIDGGDINFSFDHEKRDAGDELEELYGARTLRQQVGNIEPPAQSKAKNSRTHRQELGDLEPATTYEFTITPQVKRSAISRSAKQIFTTRQHDWPRAVLDSNEVEVRQENSILYKIAWRGASPQRYEIVVCAYRCEFYYSFEASLLYTLKYDETYNVTVTAVYDQPMVRVKRANTIFEGRSAPGAPSKVRELWKVSQQRDSIHLRWKVPEVPNGPLSYYNLTIYDAQNRSRRKEFSIRTTDSEVQVPVPLGKYLNVDIIAVNEDAGSEFAREAASFLVKFERPARPKGIEIIERLADFVKFDVIPSERSSSAHLYRVQAKEKNIDRYVQNYNEIEGLKAYETVYLSVSTCFNDTWGGTHCGDRLHTSATSNVGAPSGVSNLHAFQSENGKPIVDWSAPEHERGPIVGYFIQIIDSAHPDTILQNETIAPTEHEFEFMQAEEGKSYSFLVAAYNRDLNSGEMVIGEKLSVEAPRGLAAWIVIIIVIISVVVLGFLALQIIARRGCDSESKFLFFVFVPCSKSKTG